jgi:hypothetical protein
MNISEIHDFIGIITSQERGGFSTPAEIDAALDRASMAVFTFYRPIYATSIEAKEALAPFRVKYEYTTSGTGQITLSNASEFVRLLSMDVMVSDPTTPSGYNSDRRYPVMFVNEDELADRLNSQNKQPTATSPIADTHGIGWYDLYPQQVHSGSIYFLKRPQKPVFGYTQSERSITYNPATSTQLLWTEPYLNEVIFAALTYLGVNLDNTKLIEQIKGLLK